MQIHEGESQLSLQCALVNRWIEVFNAHDVSAIVSLYADNAKLYDSGMKHPRRGRTEIDQWFTTRFQTMRTITYTPATQLFTEPQAAATWTARGHSPRLLCQPWLSRALQHS